MMQGPLVASRAAGAPSRLPAWTRSRAVPWLCCLLLFALNIYTCRRLFVTEYLPHMHSIEGAYIALTRYTMEHWRDLGWFPLWYAGMPFQNAYQPGLHLFSAVLGTLTGLSPATAYHAAIAFLYSLGPVCLFLMTWRLSGLLGTSFAAALLYSLVSPSAFLMPSVLRNIDGLWNARRYMALVYYGEGPNVSGLTFVPLALLGIHAVFRGAPGWSWLGAAVALGSLVLVSWPAGIVLTLGVVAYLSVQRWPDAARRLPALLLLALAAYGLISPWSPPSTVRVNQANAQHIGTYPWTPAHLLYWGLTLGGLLLLRLVLRRSGASWFLQFCVAFTWLTGAVTLTAEWTGRALLPQPERFHLGMEMALALTVPFALQPLVARWPRLRWAVWLLLAAFAVEQAGTYRYYNRKLTQPFDITQSVEYRLARWMNTHLQGHRVFASGSIAFWMNAWTDTPQVTGCCLPGLPNWMGAIASYIITSDDGAGSQGAETSLLWLKAFGAQAVATGGPQSREHYRDFVHPTKYEGKLPLLWQEGDDRLYAVPQRSASLARVVMPSQLVRRPPINGIDLEPLRPYVDALDDPSLPLAELRWLSPSRARIDAKLQQGQVLSIQVTHHSGWRAAVRGDRRTVRRDGLGLMVVEPACAGPCTIELWYDGGREMLAAKAASGASAIALVAYAIWDRRSRTRFPLP